MRTFFSFFIWVMVKAAIAQTINIPNPAAGLKYSISYTLEEKSFFLAGEGASLNNLSPLDIEWMHPHTTVKQIERRVDENNHHSTTINILNPAEAYADFPRHIGRIEINQQGMQVYDTDGILYQNIVADAKYQSEYNAMSDILAEDKAPIMYDFPSPPNAMATQQIQAGGGTVTWLPNNAWELSNGDRTIRFEPAKGRITTTNYEEGALKNTRIQVFDYTPQGIYAPSEDITKRPLIRPSGACMVEVVKKRYSNYSIAAIPSQRSAPNKSRVNQSTTIWPNPASDKLIVSLGTEVLPDTELQIIDFAGKVIHRQAVEASVPEVEISIHNWADGVYFVRLETRTGFQTMKFIKHSN